MMQKAEPLPRPAVHVVVPPERGAGRPARDPQTQFAPSNDSELCEEHSNFMTLQAFAVKWLRFTPKC
jgi:hypothetical protein